MTSDVARWLSDIGLSQYIQPFDDNDITTDDLADLTDSDLKELGVSSMGHRKLILRSAAQTELSTTPEPETAPPASQAEATNEQPQTNASVAAERRQLTVMFADLVGSTEMSGRMDPEDMREAITLYQECVTKHVLEIEGHVAKYMGDGVLCYFGWPQAHEDDAERASRAALNIISNLHALKAPNGEQLEARIGIATGLVVVGDIVGEGAAQEEAVVGETPNLAARLQGLAQPGQVVVSDATRNLLSAALEVEHLGEHNLKGISRPVDAFSIVGVRNTSDLAQIDGKSSRTRLAGRETDLMMLKDRWHQSTDGEGQVFLLCGEPGIGKSQVVSALAEYLADQKHMIMHFQCSPYFASSAFYPIVGYLERAAGFSRDDDTSARLDKLEALLGSAFDQPKPVAALFASIMSLPVDRYPAIGLEPVKQREQSISAFAEFVARRSRKAPVLFLFEDAHWSDATTIELLSVMSQQVDSAQVMMLITHRPEFQPPWKNIGHVTNYNLNRLAKRHSKAIISMVTNGKELPDQIVQQILDKADGIPLFVEELTALLRFVE